ncbi:MAG: 2Fe-2S iron-sulfur cluster-binding protein [Roseiarcus sp.]
MENYFTIDEQPVPFAPGQTILEACKDAGIYVPHLCHHPDFTPHGSCKLCTVIVNGRTVSGCSVKVAVGQEVVVDTPELNAMRRSILQMLFVEGNHFCPGCERSGNCRLQALGYEFEMTTPHFAEFFPNLGVDASHPDAIIDRNRCIQCELCVRASRDVDHKEVFGLAGRGFEAKLIINSPSGLLVDSAFAITDKAAHVCPVGAILIKRVGYSQPIGKRRYDLEPISAETEKCELAEG